jgi:thymidylate kinase
MPLTIILEGCDCVGKSTLASGLAEFFKKIPLTADALIERHSTYPPKELSREEQIEYQKNSYDEQIKEINDSNNVYLYDRFLLGEKIYGPKYRNYTPDYINEFEKRFNLDMTFLFILTADADIVKSRYDGEFIRYEDIEWLLTQYETEFKTSNVRKKILLDTTRSTPQEVLDIVLDTIKSTVERYCANRALADLKRNLGCLSHNIVDPLTFLCSGYLLQSKNQSLHELVNWSAFGFDMTPLNAHIMSGTKVVQFNGIRYEHITLQGDLEGKLVSYDPRLVKATIETKIGICCVYHDNILNIAISH